MRRLLPALLAALAVGCSDDNRLQLVPCVDPGELFDIENVSQLEDVEALVGGADAVVLDMTGAVPEDGGWRVTNIDVLVVAPEAEFQSLAGKKLGLVLWDAATPAEGQPMSLDGVLDPAQLAWETGTLSMKLPCDGDDACKAYDAAMTCVQGACGVKCEKSDECTQYGADFTCRTGGCAGTGGKRPPVAVRQAWWPFDFSKLVRAEGMASRRYVVGVRWTEGDRPLVGMSNYNRPCARNWTDRGDGRGWKQQSTDEDSDFCSWPMFRVHTEIITQRFTCEPEDGGS